MGLFLTSEGGWLGPIITIFGKLMNYIFIFLEQIGFGNIGIAIIVFTLITRILMHPMTLQQQKSSRMMSIVQPEIQAIQRKYKDRQDKASMMLQQQEIKAVYDKYGISMSGSCLQLLIQMPIIFALYRVIINIPAYVGTIKDKFMQIVDAMVLDVGSVENLCIKLKTFAENDPNNKTLLTILKQVKNFGLDNKEKFKDLTVAQKDFIVDFLYKLNPNQINDLGKNFSQNAQNVLSEQMQSINNMNSFCGINLATAPRDIGFTLNLENGMFNVYLLIPILAFASQYISSKIMQKSQQRPNAKEEDNTMQQSMNTMMIMMPIMSAFFTWGFASGLGLYWIVSAVLLCLQQLVVNAQLKNMNMDDVIKQNIEKANAKRLKKGEPLLDTDVTVNTIKRQAEKEEQEERKREEILKHQSFKEIESEEYYFKNEENPDSIFAKAGMVKKYNDKHNK